MSTHGGGDQGRDLVLLVLRRARLQPILWRQRLGDVLLAMTISASAGPWRWRGVVGESGLRANWLRINPRC
jgi:hypothetical protein